MLETSRRQFILTASAAAAATLAPAPLRAAAMESVSAKDGSPISARRLNAGWQFRRGPLDGIWQVWRSEETALWQEASLPHCFNDQDACDPDQPYFRGEGWYRTRLSLNNPLPQGRTLLHFQGAGQTSTLWVGSTQVGTHTGGYDEFVYDITDAVARVLPDESRGGVPVAVCCDNGPDLNRVPSDLSDFCLYGGLYRHVNLVYLPALSLDSVHILPTLGADGAAEVSVKARLYNPSSDSGKKSVPCKLTVDVLNPRGASVHRSTHSLDSWAGMTELTSFRIAAAELWSPETPHLYRCRISLSSSAGETALEERFGVRTAEFVEHGPFKLNGKRVLLRGTHRHADHAGLAAAMSDDLVRHEMQLIKEMGVNFVRLAHYQQDRLVLDLCDELGLLVWEEVPWCRSGIGGKAFEQNAKAMLTNLIDQHYNHPSIILWGLGNEDDWPNEYPAIDEAAIRSFMTTMRDLSHTLDSSRLTAFRRCDFARDIPDVYSPSIWAGWYRGNYREYEDTLLKERERVKRFINMEWGADSHAGRHAEDPEAVLHAVSTGRGTDERGLDYMKTGGEVRVSRDGDWSETYACDLFDWHLKTQEKLPWFTGSAQWVFKDFPSPLRSDDGIPNMNQKGVVQRDFTKKESYYVFQSYWTEKPMAHIYGHTWPIRWGKPGEERIVKVYSNCERAELFLNGKSMGTKQRDSQDFAAAGLRWNVAFQSGQNQLRVVAHKGDAVVTDEIGLTYQTESWGPPAELRITEASREGNTVTIQAQLYDAKGVRCLDSRKSVRFSLAGSGKLIDNLGTTRGSRVVQLYNGRAETSFIRTGGCTIGVTAEGLPAGFINLS